MQVHFAGRGGVASLSDRARGLAARFGRDITPSFDFSSGAGPLGRLRAFWRTLRASRSSDLLWLQSQHPLALAAASLGGLLFRTPFVVDTGDLLYESVRTMGHGRLFCELVRVWERLSLRLPDAMVVRGTEHVRILGQQGVRRVVLIPDGVDCARFARGDGGPARERLAVGKATVVGVISSVSWEPRLKISSPGWDVVECVARLRDLDVVGLVIGDGPGLAPLKEMADRRGVSEHMRWVPRVPLDEVPTYLSAIDVFLHTALNNPMSAVRTTGKLPLLLAGGCAAVVSAVGEATRVLEGTGMLLEFDGTLDQYAERLAARVREIILAGQLERWRETGPAIARREFDYSVLSARAERLCVELMRR